MNIAYFLEAYHPYVNGVISYVSMMKTGLERQGHNVLVVAADPTILRHKYVDGVLYCPAKRIKSLYGYGLALPVSVKRYGIIKKFNPDIIHIHNEFSISLFGANVAKLLHRPLIYTLHTMYDDYIYYIAKGPLKPIVRSASYKYFSFFANSATMLLSPSKKAVEYFKKCGVKKPVLVVPNSIDMDMYDYEKIPAGKKTELRESLGLGGDDITVAVFIGRLGKEKSIDYLLECFAAHIKPEDKLRLLVIGDGPEKQALRDKAHRLGIDNMVVFAGKIEHSLVPAYYAAADLFVSASLTEMMSISMMEAVASGLTAVLRLDPQNADQIKQGVNGYLFEKPEEMAAILKMLAQKSPEEKAEMRKTVRESMRELGIDESASRLIEIYKQATTEYAKKRRAEFEDSVGL